jgi:hypothetical protein
MTKSSRLKKWFLRVKKNPDVDYYALLGIELFEEDKVVILEATGKRLELLQKLSNAGLEVEVAKDLMSRITKAKLCLCSPSRRRRYDHALEAGKLDELDKSFSRSPRVARKNSELQAGESEDPKTPDDSDTSRSEPIANADRKTDTNATPEEVNRNSSAAKLARSKINKEKKSSNNLKTALIVGGLIACSVGLAAAIVFVNDSLNQASQPKQTNSARSNPEFEIAPVAAEKASPANIENKNEAKKTADAGIKTKPSKEKEPKPRDSGGDVKVAAKPKMQQVEMNGSIAPVSDSKKSEEPAAETKTTKPAKKAVRDTTVNPPKLPFKGFRPNFELPPISNTKEIKIDDLVISRQFLMGAELLFDKAWARNKIDFELLRSEHDKQTWLVKKRNRPSEDPVDVAQFRKDENSFRFQWLPAAKEDENVNYLRNGARKLSTPDGMYAWLDLRKPASINGFKLPNGKSQIETFAEIPYLPVPKLLDVQISGFDDKQVPSHCIPELASKSPARMFFTRQENEAFIWMEIFATGKSDGFILKAQLNAAYIAGATPALFDFDVFKQYMNSVNDKAAGLTRRLKQAAKKKDKEQEKKLSRQLKPVKKLGEVLTNYFEVVPKIYGRDIPIEIYLDGKIHKILIARTAQKSSGIAGPANAKKK